ncbi:HpcH/HpaI aldolase family protein [Methylobacterium haplocladii]|uniref:Siderophore biosynthesis protein SbnG n=1 Tax=Methylobacterium haplocladii TaxID=1176176 RepID=A0A512INM9_9HYPH|nr:aldolase/citrate lyase family protein [Methylobacterium haplocladii]GEO99314.1 siderophore biosynthesis protein SbnG [Methylobacterium haplocladii]GJD83485.1 4-hydroxy-2-oxovalerate aldolase [Methylobacterium haplocladii]GLS61086.1 siderophore biosynthesis protein SbnG [Methylobacterium haplocladii]
MSARLRLKTLLDRGRPAGGLFVSIPASEIVEIAAVAGFDFVLIDLEHTLIDGGALERLLAAADRAGVSALVRVPNAASERILQSLDAGAAGIVVPRVESPEQAEETVRNARYAPRGIRGLNAGRLGRFGDCDLPDLVARLDRETLVIAMIETPAGLDAAERIARLDGIDGLLFGAADYSQAIGLPWQTGAEAVTAAGTALARICRQAGILNFAFARSEADTPKILDEGTLGVIAANDRGLLRRALTESDRGWRAAFGDQA